MKALRISIAGSMILVLLLTFGFAAFRAGTENWFRSLYTITVAILLVSTLASKYCRGASASYWFGFSVVGWTYLILGLGLRPEIATNIYGDVNEQAAVNNYLITTIFLKYLCIKYSNFSNVDNIGKYGYDLAIAHLAITWALAAGGGLFACVLRAIPHKKLMLAIALSSVFIAGSLPILAVTQGPYFPEKAFQDRERADAFLNDEYGRHLEAMGEPSLWRLSRKDKTVEVYRFLRLHPRQHPICVRVEKRANSLTLRLVILDGVWVDEPGLIAVDKSMSLTISQWDELVRHAEQSGLWSLGKEDRDSVELLDNNRVLVEGLKGGSYRLVARWSGYDEQIVCKNLCEYLLILTNTVHLNSDSQNYAF
jgi:hypothetical protein